MTGNQSTARIQNKRGGSSVKSIRAIHPGKPFAWADGWDRSCTRRVVYVGGNANNGSNDGLAYRNVNNGLTNANVNISGRLPAHQNKSCHAPYSICGFYAASHGRKTGLMTDKRGTATSFPWINPRRSMEPGISERPLVGPMTEDGPYEPKLETTAGEAMKQ